MAAVPADDGRVRRGGVRRHRVGTRHAGGPRRAQGGARRPRPGHGGGLRGPRLPGRGPPRRRDGEGHGDRPPAARHGRQAADRGRGRRRPPARRGGPRGRVATASPTSSGGTWPGASTTSPTTSSRSACGSSSTTTSGPTWRPRAETARLLDETDPAKVGWCLDIGHLAYGGGNSLEMLGHLRRPGGSHPPQGRRRRGARAGQGRGTGASGRRSRPTSSRRWARGSPRCRRCVEALLGRGYDGWFVLEQDTCRDDPKDVARVNREYLEGLLGPRRDRLMGERRRRASLPAPGPTPTSRRSPGAGASTSSRRSRTAARATWAARCRRWTCWSRSTSACCGSGRTSRTGRSGTGSSCPRATAPWPSTP